MPTKPKGSKHFSFLTNGRKKKKRPAPFKFKPFSKKQKQVLTWWRDGSPVKDMDGIICDGSVRAGKTVVMSLSYVMWAMHSYQEENFGMAGKTIGSFRRNVITPLKRMLRSRGYKVKDHRSENMLSISKNGITNYFYIFGGKDEGSQDLIQGITLAGMFFDEVALMPESFVSQATARCSVKGAKFWFNCNPEGPYHWFKEKWIDKREEKRLIQLHFTMDDNLSLDDDTRQRYERMYSGVFYQRFILGLWVAAHGIIYSMFEKLKHVISGYPLMDDYVIGIDYGTSNPTAFILIGIKYQQDGTNKYYILDEYYHDGRKDGQLTDKQHYANLKKFVSESKPLQEHIKRNPMFNPNHMTIYLDPSAASFKAEIHDEGLFRVIEADNDVLNGIRTVQSMISSESLYVHDNCENVKKEFASYIWDSKAGDKGVDKPIKEHDHCLTGDTIINTVHGDIPIKELTGKTGEVYCFDESNNCKTVSSYYDVRLTQRNADVYKIETEDGRIIKATAEHPILTKKGWKRLDELTTDDEIVDIKEYP